MRGFSYQETLGGMGEECNMVTPIDAVRCGMGFDETGHWHEARARRLRVRQPYGEESAMAPARGVIYGLAGSVVLWVAIAAIGKMLLWIR